MRPTLRSALPAALLAGLACASEGFPPGGPPDDQPPVLVETEPADRSVKGTADQVIRLRFDEPIDPRQEREIPELVVVNPDEPGWEFELDGAAITLRPAGSLVDELTYSVTILPGLRDREGNTTTRARSILFSIGGETPITLSLVRARIVQDTVPVAGARYRLDHQEEEYGYTMRSDSQGMVSIEGVAYGPYVATAWIEQVRPEEWQFTQEPGARDTFELSEQNRSHDTQYAIAVVDTTPPVVVRAEALDSRRLSVVVDDALAGEAAPVPTQARLWEAPLEISRADLRLDSIPAENVKGRRIPVVAVTRIGPDRLELETGAPLEDGRVYRLEFVDVENVSGLVMRPEGGLTFRVAHEGPRVWDAEPVPWPESGP